MSLTTWSVSVWRVSADGADRALVVKVFTGHVQTIYTVGDINSPAGDVTQRQTTVQLDAGGNKLRRVQLPDYMKPTRHAVELATGTFIISHKNTTEPVADQ